MIYIPGCLKKLTFARAARDQRAFQHPELRSARWGERAARGTGAVVVVQDAPDVAPRLRVRRHATVLVHGAFAGVVRSDSKHEVAIEAVREHAQEARSAEHVLSW